MIAFYKILTVPRKKQSASNELLLTEGPYGKEFSLNAVMSKAFFDHSRSEHGFPRIPLTESQWRKLVPERRVTLPAEKDVDPKQKALIVSHWRKWPGRAKLFQGRKVGPARRVTLASQIKWVTRLVGSPFQPSQHFVSHENNSPSFVRKCWKSWVPRGSSNRWVTPLLFHQGPRAVSRELKQQRRPRLRKRQLKSEFALPQTLSRLFHLV